jgi:hypothetical protein
MQEETKPQAPNLIEPLDDDGIDGPSLCLPMLSN